MAKINHFIVLLLENRSFDHIFGFAQPSAGQQIDNIAAMAEVHGRCAGRTRAVAGLHLAGAGLRT